MLEQLGLDGVRRRIDELGLAAAGVLLTFVGSFGPWFAVERSHDFPGIEDVGYYGINGDDGKLALILAVLAGIALIRYATSPRPLALLAVLTCGLAVGLLAIVSIVSLQKGTTTTWGLWLTGAGGFGMTMGALLIAHVRNTPGGEPEA